jgi:predicted DNA-binding transcriptional regulator AlpA
MDPDLSDLLTDPAHADSVPRERVPDLLGALEQARAALWKRLLGRRDEAPAPDRLLTIEEAAARLAVAENWLRRRSELPFVVRLSPGNLRYSEQGIERFIQRRQRS